MLYRILAALALAGALPGMLRACDVCGCGVGGGGFGLLSVYRNNYVGLSHGFMPFRSRLTSGEYTGTRDVFHTTELLLRYEPLSRWRVDAFLPFRTNVRRSPDGDVTLSGVGDVRVGVAYVLADGQPLGAGRWSAYWEAGLIASVPTGAYDDDLLGSHYLPDNFNLGKGAVGGGLQTALVIANGRYGVTLNARHQRYATSTPYYRFGAETEAGARVFGQFTRGAHWTFIPYAGASYERVAANTIADALPVHGTGGRAWLAAVGLNLRYDAFTLALQGGRAFDTHYANGLARSGFRGSVQLLFNF